MQRISKPKTKVPISKVLYKHKRIKGGNAMPKVVYCPCGYVVRAASEEELVEQAQQHAKGTHDMTLTREQALAMARPE